MLEQTKVGLRSMWYKVFGWMYKQPNFVVDAYILVHSQEEADEIKEAIHELLDAKYGKDETLAYITAMSQEDSDALDEAFWSGELGVSDGEELS